MSGYVSNFSIAYKFKNEGKWTPLLHFVKQDADLLVFKPVEDTESTDKIHVISLFVTTTADKTCKEFKMCQFYGTWEKAPHVCGTDCPLGK